MCNQDQPQRYEGRVATLRTISIVLWLSTVALTGFDLGANVPGIIVAIVGLAAATTTLATVQVWSLDCINRTGTFAITRHGVYQSAHPNDIRMVIGRPAAVGRSAIEDDTAQIPKPADTGPIAPSVAGQLFRLGVADARAAGR